MVYRGTYTWIFTWTFVTEHNGHYVFLCAAFSKIAFVLSVITDTTNSTMGFGGLYGRRWNGFESMSNYLR